MTTTAKKQIVSANPTTIEWPQDEYRITQALKKEGTRLASRVGNQRDKLAVALQTIDTLRGHLIARYKKHNEMQKEVVEAAKRTADENKAREEAAAARRVEALKAELDALEGKEEASV